MEEAAESQYKVCNIHFKQMEKADRDNTQGQRAEDECRQVMVQFPNSKFVPQAQQKLRDVQEVLADKEFRTGLFYHTKGSFPPRQTGYRLLRSNIRCTAVRMKRSGWTRTPTGTWAIVSKSRR